MAVRSQGYGHSGKDGSVGPKGDKGDPGIAGLPGVKGETGAQGAQGPQGERGLKGDTGAQGATGAPGTAGAKGDKGDMGSQGPAGSQGAKGDPGATGATGAKGDTGPSAKVALPNVTLTGTILLGFLAGTVKLTVACLGAKVGDVFVLTPVNAMPAGFLLGDARCGTADQIEISLYAPAILGAYSIPVRVTAIR